MNDELLMQQAVELARQGLGKTFPNPSVACLVVKDGVIIASARTADSGRPHAETLALAQLSQDQAKDTDIYLTLEPCFAHAHTPPCVDQVIAVQPRRVIIACQDPNPTTCGKSLAKLRQAGIQVELGIEDKSATEVNRGFFKVIQQGLPLVTLKMALTIDGKIAMQNGESKWITEDIARNYAHRLRERHDAIMVGVGTVLRDDPALDCRLEGLTQYSPIKIICDSNLRTPERSRIFNNPPAVFIMTSTYDYENQPGRVKDLQEAGAKIVPVSPNTVDLRNALQILAKQEGITRILSEGGATLAAGLIQLNLVDDFIVTRAPKLIGSAGISAIGDLGLASLAEAPYFTRIEILPLGNDIAEIYRK